MLTLSLLLPLLLSATPTPSADVDRFASVFRTRVSLAAVRTRRIEIVVEPPSILAYWPAATEAHATRDPTAPNTCLIHIRPQHLHRREVIAHEVCHCMVDWPWMAEGGEGWRSGVSQEARRAAEYDARDCEAQLLEIVDRDDDDGGGGGVGGAGRSVVQQH